MKDYQLKFHLNCWSVTAIALGLALANARGEIKTDIEYGVAEGERLLLDVNVPEGAGPFPVAILVHGGGWSGGDKSGSNKSGDGADITPWFAPLTAAKFVWCSINYRLTPQHRWPGQLDDVETSIRWVKAHAKDFHGDPMRIALIGHSSGGHVVMMAATSQEKDLQVQAVVGCAAVTDLEADFERRGGVSGVLLRFYGREEKLTPESRASLRELSPINHVHARMPPVLLLHGDADKSVPLEQSVAFQTRLRRASVPCELIVLPGAPHRLLEWKKADPHWTDRMMSWLVTTLGDTAAKPVATTPKS